MNTLLKQAREKKGIMLRELAQMMGIDQSLISKFESGHRKPTKEQLERLAHFLDLEPQELMVQWIKSRVLYALGDDEDLALRVVRELETEMSGKPQHTPNYWSSDIQTLLDEIDALKLQLDSFRQFDSYRIAQALELEYTFESNRIEGNTLTLRETDLVINEGLTISGKSMREHLEAVNHKEAIEYIRHLVDKEIPFNERELLTLHNLILRSIDPSNAGQYRRLQVMIKGSAHLPPAPYIVPKQMEDYFFWYQRESKKLHPVVLAAEMHERLVTIHPFIDGNGRTSRLIMNLILMRHGYVIANIKGDTESRVSYYSTLEKAQTTGNKSDFIELVARYERDALKRYLSIIHP
jgi:Fic family protein/DNA-binding Xre family transcriptional regulator